MGLELQTIELADIERMQKQSIRSDVNLDLGALVDDSRPLEGIVSEQRNRNSEAADILNIGSGTRCKHCGMLHFLWRETCGACKKPMEYNLGHRDEGARE